MYAAALTVRARVHDGVASTEIEQVVRNGGDVVAEADWLLPLPDGAVADGFTMTIGDRTLQGEVLDATRARAIYQEIVQRRRDPGLLEYYGHGCLRARVFPIPGRGEVVVKVRFRHVLPPLDGLHVWSLPLRALAAGDLPPQRCAVDLTIDSTVPLANVFAPHTDVEVRRRDDHHAQVSFAAELRDPPERDLQVFYGLSAHEFGMLALSCKRAGEDGYFALLLSPKRVVGEGQQLARCVQFVLDTSGSMSGRKIEQAKAALRFFVRSLRGCDSFNVIPFATEAAPCFAYPAPVNALSIDAAMRRIDAIAARGGTNIEHALRCALATEAPAAGGAGARVLPIVVFLTDGQPTVGETDRTRLLARARVLNKTNARLFVFGVGDSLDAKLLDQLAEANGGSRDYVREHEDIELKTSALLAKLSNPVLTDLQLGLDGLGAYDVQPKRLPDLFHGAQIVVCGRYRTPGKHTLCLRGRMAERTCEYAQVVEFVHDSVAHDFVPALWAQRQVAYLLDAIHQHGRNQEVLDEVRRLAREFGVVTPFTSHLIVEEGTRLAGRDSWQAGGGASGPHGARTAPADPALRGPTTAGPSGPATPGPATAATGPRIAGSGGEVDAARQRLERLGRNDQGPDAVADSRDIGPFTGCEDFYLGGTRRDAVGSVRAAVVTRRVGARTFYQLGPRWIDTACKDSWEKQVESVPAFSAEYFGLLEQHPDLRAVFALGERVVVVVGERVLEVVPGKPR